MMRFVLLAMVVGAQADNVQKQRVLHKLSSSIVGNFKKDTATYQEALVDFTKVQAEAQTDADVANNEISALQSNIEEYQQTEDGLAARMNDLEADIATSRQEIEDCENERSSAKRILSEDEAEFNAKEKDADVAHGAVQAAKEQISSLLQTSTIDKFAHKTALRLIQMSAPSDEQKGIDNDYGSQTGGIQATLSELAKKFLAQKNQAAAQRTEAQQQESLLSKECTQVESLQKKRVSSLQSKLQTARSKKSNANAKRVSYEKEKADQEKLVQRAQDNLAESKADQKKEEERYAKETFNKNSAMNVLCPEITDGTQEEQDCHNDILPPAPKFFMQMSQESHGIDKISEMLMEGSKKLQQPILAQLAAEMSVAVARANPMKKIEDMIFNMINKLKDESLKERTLEGQCDSQLDINKEELATRQKNTNTQFAEMKEQQAISQKISNQIQDTQDRQDDIDFKRKQEADAYKALDNKRMDLITSFENAKETVADAKSMLDGGEKNANKAFGEAVEALQKSLEENINQLQAARDNSRKTEENAVREHKDLTSSLETQTSHDNSDKANADSAAADADARHANERKAFEEAKEEAARLKEQCTDREETFEERVARRENTIAMLKDANQMLKSRSQ